MVRNIYSTAPIFIIKAVDKHFSNILDLKTLEKDSFMGESVKIKFKSDPSKYLIIHYKFNTRNPRDKRGSVESGFGANLFEDYDDLRKAIRSAIMQIRQETNDIFYNNINNEFVMSGGHINKYLKYKKKYLNLKG